MCMLSIRPQYKPPEKYQIINMMSITLSFMWCAQSSNGKVGKVAIYHNYRVIEVHVTLTCGQKNTQIYYNMAVQIENKYLDTLEMYSYLPTPAPGQDMTQGQFF